MDQIDIKLLQLLQQDATLTNKELALQVNKSIGAIHDRLSKLKASGKILKFTSILNKQMIGIKLVSFSQVYLKSHSAEALKEFETHVIAIPEIMECFHISGPYDYLLRVASKSMEDYHLFFKNKLAVLPNVDRVQTCFVLSEAKSETGYPLDL